MKRLIGISASLILLGCSASTTDLSIGNELTSSPDSKSLLVVAVGPLLTAGHINFERVNDNKSGFDDEDAYLGYGAYGSSSMLKRPEGESSSFWKVQTNQVNFLVSTVKPGLYSATDTSFNSFNGVSTIVHTNCMRDGAATFVIQPGKINIILLEDAFPQIKVSRLADMHTEETLRDAFERTRANYPNVKGEPIFIEPIQEARWLDGNEGFFKNACQNVADGSFTLSRRTVSGESAIQDNADRAAIDAALENLENK